MASDLVRPRWPVVAGLLVLVGGLSCREVPQAPIGTPPAGTLYTTVTLDTVCPSACDVDVGNVWAGVTLLQPADQSVHILVLDDWAERLRYHGCTNVCEDRADWVEATGDTLPVASGGFDVWSTAVLTPAGIQVVYTYCPVYFACTGIRYASCQGGCQFGQHWTDTSLFVGKGTVQGAGVFYLGQATSLAADPAGGLHLLLGAASGALLYEYCAGLCTSQASWQEVQLDSAAGQVMRLIAFDPRSGVHVFYATGAGLMHASCAANCTSAGSWTSGLAIPGASVQGLSVASGPDGRLHLAYVNEAEIATYGTCAAPCGAPGSWTVVGLPLRTREVSLATDRAGGVFLATTYAKVALSRCDSNCLDLTAWRTTVLDSAQGSGHVSVAVDSLGRARIASTSGSNILQYTRMLQ